MLFATENLLYWLFLGLGGVLFLVAFQNKDRGEANPLDNPGPSLGSGADRATSSSDARQAVVPGKPRKPPVPLMLRVALTLMLWGILGCIANGAAGVLWSVRPQGLLWLSVMVITFLAALLTSQYLVSPVSWVINSRRKTASFDYLVGCIGIVSSNCLSTPSEGDVAQVDVVDPMGNTLTVNAALPIWATIVPQQGDRVTLIERSAEEQLYYAVAYDSADQDRWLKRAASI